MPACPLSAASNSAPAAQVKDGEYHGQKGKVGEVAWLTLDGKIEPDGTAAIFAKGLVGASAFAVGNAQSGSQYSFHVLAQFDRTGGNGRRIEGRTCNLSFVKQ
jgi:hypothetical protein